MTALLGLSEINVYFCKQIKDIMQIIYDIAKPFDKLLKKQKVIAGEQYRPMYYVVEQPVDEGLLLYHTMTKALLLLTPEEAEIYHTTPADLQELISLWFLVPQSHDDRLLSRQIRDVAKIVAKPVKGITWYSIMTTTDCNARCFYCYEKGHAKIPMSKETAGRTADYIIRHCEGKKVCIQWFGGEPLFNKPIITQICQLLKEAGVEYESRMISNGYLLDDETVAEACSLWHLKRIQITLDGTEEVYNRCKAYIYNKVNAYQRVIGNIHRLQNAGIKVLVRMNVDMHNVDNLMELVDELHQVFPNPNGIYVYVHPLFEEEKGWTAIHDKQKRKVVFNKMLQIRDRLTTYGFFKDAKLRRKIKTYRCMANNEGCINITPTGDIGKCDHYSDDNFVSHIDSEEWDEQMLSSFRKTHDEIDACKTCFDYPNCFMLKKCLATRHCFPESCDDQLDIIKREMLIVYDSRNKQNKVENEIQD